LADWLALLAGTAIGQGSLRTRGPRRPDTARGGWRIEPRNAVVLALASVLLLGGGRRWLQSRRSRRAVELLAEPNVSTEAILEASRHGRAGLLELFRILGTAPEAERRDAAGRALAILWAQDQLIAEEEKAIVTRGFDVTWQARRRYPRRLGVPIPIAVSFGVPFLRGQETAGVLPANLQWCHRVRGSERASLEQFSDWKAGPGRLQFDLEPGDFPANGPHTLVLEARVRTAGLTESWELDLPHVPFRFEFDPLLEVDALLALADDARAEEVARAVILEPGDSGATYLDLNEDLALRDPPELAVAVPLPSDLAHRVEVEFEGIEGRFPAGGVLLSGQGTREPGPRGVRRFPLGPIRGLSAGAIDRAGTRRMRAILTADPGRGWADPGIRSIAPGTVETGWVDVRVIRR